MSLEIEWSSDAEKQLRRLDHTTRERIRQAVYRFSDTGEGDVVKLRHPQTGLRLRVGNWRVRFDYSEDSRSLLVYSVLPRGEAYRRR